MQLFPYFIIRLASGNMKNLHRLEVPKSVDQVQKIMEATAEIDLLKNKINQNLFETISQQEDTNLQNKLLQLKRDIHNQRPINENILDLPLFKTSSELKDDINVYMQLERALESLKAECEDIYNSELKQTYKHLYTLSLEENLRKGMVLSNQSLIDNMDKYIPRVLNNSPRKKEWQTILGMMKYLTRMTTKTSPFSVFNNIGLGTIENSLPKQWDFDGEWGAKSVVRLNNYLFAYLKEAILNVESIRKQCFIQLNPSVSIKGEHLYFLTNSNNIESFQQIPISPVNTMIKEEISAKKIEYQGLLDILGQQVDAPYQSLKEYLDSLIDIGFVEFKFSTSGVDPDWDIHFSAELQHLKDKNPLITDLIDALQKLKQLTSSIENACEKKRKTLLNDIHGLFSQVYTKLLNASSISSDAVLQEDKQLEEQAFKQIHFEDFKLKPHQIVFEDSKHTANFRVSKAMVTPLVEKINQLCRLMSRFEVQLDRKDKLKHYYTLHYSDQKVVDVLDFYENYYRDVELPEITHGINMPGSKVSIHKILEVPDIKTRQERNKKWEKELAEALKPLLLDDANHLNLTTELLEGLNSNEKEVKSSKTVQSLSAFTQLFKTEGEEWKAVLNLTYAGYGRMYSRFLHIVDPEVSEQLRKKNQDMGQEGLMVENTDASYFNANLRPPLMPYELEVPNGHRNLPEGNQIPVTEVGITYCQKTDQLQLLHKPTAKPLYLFDLGFQSLRGRSQLYQLLERFTPATYVYPTLLSETINSALYLNKVEKGAVTVQFPRITFEEDIIIQRKTWFFAKKGIPVRHPNESDAMFFLRLNQWRMKNEIPSEVFIYVTTPQEMAALPLKEQQKVGLDNQKPQYISFYNPILIRLFEKMSQKVPKVLKIEEMLPQPSQLARMNDNQIVNECVFQWYN